MLFLEGTSWAEIVFMNHIDDNASAVTPALAMVLLPDCLKNYCPLCYSVIFCNFLRVESEQHLLYSLKHIYPAKTQQKGLLSIDRRAVFNRTSYNYAEKIFYQGLGFLTELHNIRDTNLPLPCVKTSWIFLYYFLENVS